VKSCFLKTLFPNKQTGRSVLVIAFLWVLLLRPAAAQNCDIETRAGKPDTKFESIFLQNGPGTGLQSKHGPAWTGGDSTYSILLPNGNSAFFFSDGYIAESPPVEGDGRVFLGPGGNRLRKPNCQPPLCTPATSLFRSHNSIVVLENGFGSMRTFTGPTDKDGYSTSLFTPEGAASTKRYYWMGDSVVVKKGNADKLWVFLLEFDSALAYYGSAIAQLSLPDMKVESIKKIGGTDKSTVAWGSALLLDQTRDGPLLYIYGIQNKQKINGKVPYLARVSPNVGFERVADAANWTVWNGTTWVTDLVGGTQLIGAGKDPKNNGDQISDEFSVKKIRIENREVYVLVGMDTTIPFGSWKDITIYSACRPEGPFSAKKIVYSTPETNSLKLPGITVDQQLAGPLVVYNPHLHPQFNNSDGMLVSYNTNTTKHQDLLLADSYRPRFIRVPIKGLR